MRLIVAVDPGLRECGVCAIDVQTSAVRFAFLARNPEKVSKDVAAWERMAHAVAVELEERLAGDVPDLLVIERQFLGFGSKNPGVILTLCHVAGAIAMRVDALEKTAITPSQWKGSTSKKKSNRKTWSALAPGEKAVAEEAETYKGHNVKDSIGIAKWAARHYAQLDLLRID